MESVQAFLNTAPIRKKREEIGSPGELARWRGRGLLGDGVKLTVADHRRAIGAREALLSLLASNNGATFDPKAIDRLEEALAFRRGEKYTKRHHRRRVISFMGEKHRI